MAPGSESVRTGLLSPSGAPVFGLSPDGPDAATTVASLVDRSVDVVNIFKSWMTAFPADELTAITDGGSLPAITWEPWNPGRGSVQPAFSLTRIVAGAFDDYLRTWARRVADWPGTLALRFAHEMNGGWYPWGVTTNGNNPADYVAAYRHVHDLFRRAGATNVLWIWCPNVVLPRSEPLEAMYPGDQHVDLIGLDGYNGGTDVPGRGGWLSPEQIFQPTLAALAGIAPATRVLLNETASTEQGGSKGHWIDQLVGYVQRESRLAGFVWFNVHKDTDWRIQSSAESIAAMRSALERYPRPT